MLGAKLQAFFGRLNASNVRSCEGLPVVDERHLADSMRLVDEAQLNNGAIVRRRGRYAATSWAAETVLRIRLQVDFCDSTEAGSVETTNSSAPF